MAYRKFAADHIFTGTEMLSGDMVLVTDNAGVIQSVIPAGEAGDDVQKFDGILTPGFINCHCHLELSHLRGAIPPGCGLVPFLLSVMDIRNASHEFILDAITAEERAMTKRGIVAVGDICNTDISIAVKESSGLYFHNFVEALGVATHAAGARFSQALKVYNSFVAAGMGASIVPHAPYSVSDALMKMVNDFDEASLLSIHNQESEAETDFFLDGRGPLLELYSKIGIERDDFVSPARSSVIHFLSEVHKTHPVLLVHNVQTTNEDLRLIYRGGSTPPEIWWCFCPNANLYISGQLPDISLFQKFTSNFVLGTDSLASNVQLDILEEIKTIRERMPWISLDQLLTWSTRNGASALRIDDRYGSFEAGKKPGIVIIRCKDLLLTGASAERIL